VLAAHVVGPGGHVIAFEQHPQALGVFRASLTVNRVEAIVEVIEAAVGAGPEGTTSLFLSVDSVLSTTDPRRSPAREHFRFDTSIAVRATSLDRWLGTEPETGPRIAAVKIDVEGTEIEVLEGMRDMRRSCPRAVILCETEAGGPADLMLRAEGYVATPLDLQAHHGTFLYAKPSTGAVLQ